VDGGEDVLLSAARGIWLAKGQFAPVIGRISMIMGH
jgi:hypothetical protein